MAFIVFIGCDGSGKSSVISRLSERLTAAGTGVRNGHWCPASGPSSGKDDASDPHGRKARGLVGSTLKLGVLAVRWWKAWLLDGWSGTARHGVVLFDRYHGDLCVDPARYRYGGPVWLARIWSGLLPAPDLLFFLDADEDVLLSRKQEVSHEALAAARRSYKSWSDSRGGMTIDVDRPVDDVVDEVLEWMRRHQK